MEGGGSIENCVQIKTMNGFYGQIRNSIFHYVAKRQSSQGLNLIYPAGNMVVCSQLTSSFQFDKVQQPIYKPLTKKGINCITQSPSRRYIAWAQQTADIPLIVIQDLKTLKRRVIGADIKSKKYISLCFNGTQTQQPKTLIALTGAPQYCLVVFNSVLSDKYRTETLLIQKLQRTDLRQEKYNSTFFFSKEQDFVLVTGRGTVKTYKLSSQGPPKPKDSPFARGKQLPDKEFNPISYCIVNKELILGTDTGQLLYITPNCQYKFALNSSPGSSSLPDSQVRIQTMVSTSKGFLIGLQQGTILIYQKPQVKLGQPFVKIDKKIQIKDNINKEVKVTSLLLTQKQQYLFVGLSNNQIYRIPFADKSYQEIDRYDSAIQKFHSKKITGMQVCLRKPYVATCSTDRTIKIWNYSQKTSLQINTPPYQQKAIALTIHPSGLHLIVAFPDKIKLFNIFQNQIIHFKQIPQKNSTDIKFSNGGHMFAILNNVTVHVYRFYTGQQPKNYQINTLAQNTSMCWEDDDQGLYVATSQGQVFYYRFQQPQFKLQVHKVDGVKITSIASIFNQISQKQVQTFERVVYFTGMFDSKKPKQEKGIYQVKIVPKLQKDRQIRQQKMYVSKTDFILTQSSISQIAFLKSGKLFIYCTSQKGQAGSIRLVKYPFSSTGGIFQIPCHSMGINCLAVTYDDMYILTGGNDGMLVTYQVKDKQLKIKMESMDPTQYFLIPKHNYMQKKEALQSARRKKAQQNQKKIKIRSQQNIAFERQIEQLRYQINQKNKSQQLKYDREEANIYSIQRAYKQALKNLTQQKNIKYETVKKDYEQKLKLEQDRLKELKKNGQSRQRRYADKKQELKKKHNQEMKNLQKQYESRLDVAKKAVQIKQKQLQQQEIIFTREQDQLQSKLQRQIDLLKDQHQLNRKQLDEASRNALAQNMTKKKDLQDSNVGLQQQKLKVKHARQSIKLSRNQHQALQQKKISFAKQIQQRQKTIKDKLTRIHQLKKKTQQLQKFKFVLDYKIRQLKRDVGPKQDQITKMNQQIDNMTNQIQHFNKTNQGMKIIVKDLKLKKQGMLYQIKQNSKTQQDDSNYIRNFQSDISALHPDASIYLDYKQLKKLIITLYRKYVQTDEKKTKKTQNVDQQKQFMKQRAHLETNVKGQKQKFEKNRKAHNKDFKRMMGHNQQLIDETNDLIRQQKNYRDQSRRQINENRLLQQKERLQKVLQAYEKKIKDATQKLNRLEEIRPPDQDFI